MRSTSRSLFWNVGLSWDNSRSLTSGTNSLTTNILLLQIGSFYTRLYGDQSNLTMAWTLWTNGKHFDHKSLNNVSSERARSELDTSYQHPFAEQWSFTTQLNMTYSSGTLTDADKFNLGGPGSVLGYQSAEQRGDSGYFLSGEVQRSFSIAARPFAWGVFLDNGKVWDKANTVNLSGGDTSRGLSSAGLDLLLVPTTNKINARLQWAYSIGRRPSEMATAADISGSRWG